MPGLPAWNAIRQRPGSSTSLPAFSRSSPVLVPIRRCGATSSYGAIGHCGATTPSLGTGSCGMIRRSGGIRLGWTPCATTCRSKQRAVIPTRENDRPRQEQGVAGGGDTLLCSRFAPGAAPDGSRSSVRVGCQRREGPPHRSCFDRSQPPQSTWDGTGRTVVRRVSLLPHKEFGQQPANRDRIPAEGAGHSHSPHPAGTLAWSTSERWAGHCRSQPRGILAGRQSDRESIDRLLPARHPAG